MTPHVKTTPTMQDYLKALLRLERQQTPVPTSALADALSVTPSAVTAMSCKLHIFGMVRYAAYYGMELTEAGRSEALRVLRAHRLVEVMMVQWMGFGWDEVDDEADRLEHVLSAAFVDRLEAQLGHPCCCPHGDPIPRADGTLDPVAELRLIDLEPGGERPIFRVSSRDPAMLRYFREIGLTPGARVKVLALAPFDGPLAVEVEQARHDISRLLAQNVFVYA